MRAGSQVVYELDELLSTTIPEEDMLVLEEFASKNPGKIFFGANTNHNGVLVPERIAEILQRRFKNLYVYRNDGVPDVFSIDIQDCAGDSNLKSFVIDATFVDDFGAFHPVDIVYNEKNDCGCTMTYDWTQDDDRSSIIPLTVPQSAIVIASKAIGTSHPLQIINTSFDETTGMLLWFEVANPNEEIGWIVVTTVDTGPFGVSLDWEVRGPYKLEDEK